MMFFDKVVEIVQKEISNSISGDFKNIIIVREVSGTTTVVLPDGIISNSDVDPLAARLHQSLGAFSPGIERVILFRSDLLDEEEIVKSKDLVALDDPRFELVDRLMTNQDWLRLPLRTRPAIPTATAFSIKGGVGRSTAFSALAWYLAQLGKRVLVIDLDLEAPGIGNILLDELPDYGLVDWLVEDITNGANLDLLKEVIGKTLLGQETSGDILVIPAFGKKTVGYVSKLGRIYMPSLDTEQQITGITRRLNRIIEQTLQLDDPPDVILLDARAGLHDIGAAAVTQLGAEVFFFARNEPQTWAGYGHLFKHLCMSRGVKWGMDDDDLRWRIKMVAAQLDIPQSAFERYVDASYSEWATFYDEEDAASDTATPQQFEKDDDAAPHYPLPIIFDSNVRGINFIEKEERPDWTFIENVFGKFMKGAVKRLFPGID